MRDNEKERGVWDVGGRGEEEDKEGAEGDLVQIHLPSQDNPSPSNPSLHSHV